MVIDLAGIGKVAISLAVFLLIIYIFVVGFKENSKQAHGDKGGKGSSSGASTTETKSDK